MEFGYTEEHTLIRDTARSFAQAELSVNAAEDGGHFIKIVGDPDHPTSKGYICNKAARIDYYQNSPARLASPMRRRPDGSYEEVDWDTAI